MPRTAGAGGGRLCQIGEGATTTDKGPIPRGYEYAVQIFMRDGGGYDIWKYLRKVTILDCK